MSTTFVARQATTFETLEGPEVNMNVGNAAVVCDLLGLDPEYGETTAADLLGRVLLAQALLDVTHDDEQGLPASTDGRWTWGARRPGYLAEKLAELHKLANTAQGHQDAVITWG